jgi:hypothetical protein
MTELTPATFDVEGWLTDAALPEESATVYKRPDVVSELSDLKRRISIESRANDVEQSAASKSSRALEKEYGTLLRTFSDSALTVYVRALSPDELKDLRAAHDERTKGMDSKAANAEFGFDLLAAAITHVKPAGGERLPAQFTPAKVKAMEEAIGSTQMTSVLAARQQAQNALPTVDADFLRKPSGTEAGQR